MRAWFWTLVLLVVAVGLAVVLREHSGNVLIIAQPYRIELSLTLAVLLVLGLFIVLYVILRVASWISSSPDRFRSWRGLRARKKDHELLESGWIHVLEGRFGEAEQELTKLLSRTRSSNTRVLAGLALARASHGLGQYARRDEALQVAQETAGNDPRLREATAIVNAEICLEQNRAQDALSWLEPLLQASARNHNAARLALRAYKLLGNHDQVYVLTRQLMRRNNIERGEARRLIEVSAAARIAQAGIEGFKPVWADLKADERTLPDIALAAAQVQDAAGNPEEAGKILEAALNAGLEPHLLNAYSQCPPDQVARRIAKAENWLREQPDNADLLAALGNLCLTGQLWGPGERYLQRSMKLRNDVRIHALLGNLYDRLGREKEAMNHWRLAAGVAGVLPVLHMHTVLPAADTRGDPNLVDVDPIPVAAPQAIESPIPVAASAADYLDADSYTGTPGTAPANAPVQRAEDASTDLEDYFDTAPIPGVDLSQTSDRPNRSNT